MIINFCLSFFNFAVLQSITISVRPSVAFLLQCRLNVKTSHGLHGSPAEEQAANFICEVVITHDVDLPLIERSNGVESAVDEIKQIAR